MNIFNKVALQGLLKSRSRTIVTIIGVVLSCTMITAVATFILSLQSYLIDGSIMKYGNWHTKAIDITPGDATALLENPSIENYATMENIGYAPLDGGLNPDKPYLYVCGMNDSTKDMIPITLLAGRFPKNDTEVIIPSHIASNAGIVMKIGDTLNLNLGSRQQGDSILGQHDSYQSGESSEAEAFVYDNSVIYTVVGIYQRSRIEEYSAPGYTLITTCNNNLLTANTLHSIDVFITLKHPTQVRSFIKENMNGMKYVLNEDVLRFMGISSDRWINMVIYAVGTILVLLIMTGSVFLIYNSFNISLCERMQQLGILASVGATKRQLRNSVLFEGLCIGMVGIPIGILVGIGAIGIVIRVIATRFGTILYNKVPLTLHISLPTILIAVVISLLTILISAYLPARKAAAVPIMDCIRQSNEIKVNPRDIKASRLERMMSLEQSLAFRNFKRNKKKYRSIVLSLVLSVVLFICANSFVTYLKQITLRANVFTTYDIGIDVHDMSDERLQQLFDVCKDANEVSNSSFQSMQGWYFAAKNAAFSDAYLQQTLPEELTGKDYLPMDLQFLDDASYREILNELGLDETEYNGQSGKLIAVSKVVDTAMVMGEPDEYVDMFKNKSESLTIYPANENGTDLSSPFDVNITFVDAVPPDTLPVLESGHQTTYMFQVLLPYSCKTIYNPATPYEEIKGLTFSTKNPSAAMDRLSSLFQACGVSDTEYKMYDMYKMLDESRNLIFIINVFAYTFIVTISLIAIANVFNTISTNIKLRRRELAMVRSVGMSDRSFQKMMNYECIFYGTGTLAFGLPIATLLSFLIYYGLLLTGEEDMHYVFPAGSMLISILGVFLIVFITMLYAVSEIKHENIIDALRDDCA